MAIYSQIKPTSGKKFVVTQKTCYWHQCFDLFVLDADVDPKSLDCENQELPKGCTHIASTLFGKPWLFFDNTRKQIYAVVRDDDPYGVNIWNVYSLTKSPSPLRRSRFNQLSKMLLHSSLKDQCLPSSKR